MSNQAGQKAEYRSSRFVVMDNQETHMVARAVHGVPSCLYTPDIENALMASLGHHTGTGAETCHEWQDDDDKVTAADIARLSKILEKLT